MTEPNDPEKARGSLADAAASWVPPWERARITPQPPTASADPPADPAPAPDPPPHDQGVPEDARDDQGRPDHGVSAEDEPVEAEPEAAAGAAPEAEPTVDAEATVDAEPVREAGPGGAPVPDEEAAPTTEAAPAADAGAPLTPVDESPAELALIDEDELRGALEAIMLVVDEPVQEIVLAQVMEQPTERVAEALEALAASYTAEGKGFELRRAAGGWRLYTRPRYATYVERFVLDGQSVRLTQAALETLAVVAYKQPVTRSRISAIRGVNVDGVMRTLTSRGLVEECGTEPDTGAHLYRTTILFLEKLGLDSVDQLPDLAPFLPDDIDDVDEVTR